MSVPLTVLSSMATRGVLAEVLDRSVRLESVGGVEAADRVRRGDPADVVVLAAPAIEGLIADGLLAEASRSDLFGSQVVVAVATGAPVPTVGTVEQLQEALRQARRIGYSTGPSGTALLALFDSWGARETLAAKLVQAPPGTPVGRLLTEGTVDIGFQQHSELLGRPGVEIVGPLPPGAEIHSTFTAAVSCSSTHQEAAAELLRTLRTPTTARTAARHGLTLIGVSE